MPAFKKLYSDEIELFQETMIEFICESNSYVDNLESFVEANAVEKYTDMAKKISEGKAIVYGAVKDDHLLGFVYAYEQPFREDNSRIYISILHVHVQTERQRIAKRLLYLIEQEALKKEYDSIFLITERLHDETTQFYEKLGFVVERIQLVKKQLRKSNIPIIKEAKNESSGVKLLTAEMIDRYKNELSELFLINTRAHILTESCDYAFAFTKITDLIGYVKENKAVVAGYFSDQKLMGFMWVFPYQYKQDERFMINAIVVFPEYRNKNIANKLYEALESVLSESGKKLYTFVDFVNSSAYRLYKNHGMVEESYQMVRRVKSE